MASRLVSVREIECGSGSDMDLGYNSDEEVYKMGYLVRSSPQDDKSPCLIDQQPLPLVGESCVFLEQHSFEEEEEGESLNCSSTSGVSVNGLLAVARVNSRDRKQCSSGDSESNSFSFSTRSEAESNQAPKPDGFALIPCRKKCVFPPKPDGCTSLRASQSHMSSAHLPIFHASGLGPWYAVIAYDACVRLCLNSWAKGCEQAVYFLNNECKLLREAFSLRSTLLQSEEEVLSKQTSVLVSQGGAQRLNRTIGKVKVQVRKVKMFSEPSSGCKLPHLPKISLKSFQHRVSSVTSRLSHSIRNRSFTRKGFGYVQLRSQHLVEGNDTLRIGKNNGSPSNSLSFEAVQGTTLKDGKKKNSNVFSVKYQNMFVRLSETFSCLMRLKSSDEEDMVRMQSGMDQTHIFFPDSRGDDLVIIVQDCRGLYCGSALAQIGSLADYQAEKLSWWPIYVELDGEPVGKVQLYMSYSTSQDDSNPHKCGMVTEAVAYDVVLETAMKAQGFQPRNFELHGHWKWLVAEFAAFFGVSDAYTKLRYLSYIMEIATPTSDCLCLLHDLLSSIIPRGSNTTTLSHQENRILGEVLEKLEQLLSVVFKNYKSLDESSCSGLADGFLPPTDSIAPALAPSVRLYSLTHDVFSSEAQIKLCRYFQAAARKRSRIHLSGTKESASIDSNTINTAYMKMKTLCLSIKDEIYTDLEIHNRDVLPSFLDLPNLTSSIYNMDLQTRLCAFLKSYPPNGPSTYIIELVVTVADFQRDLSTWKIKSLKGGVDANELFGALISNWIKDTRLALLALCVKEKACHTTKWPDVRGQTRTSPFIDDMYDQLKDTLNVYEIIISHFPSHALPLEKAIADVQNSVVEALERHYMDVLSPLKENLSRFGFKHINMLTKRGEIIYTVPPEVGILMNSMRRMLDVLWPKIELHVKKWSCYDHDHGYAAFGESLGEATITLRAKFRSYLQAIIEKIFNNTRAHSATRWKKIVEGLKQTFAESDIKNKMEPLSDLIANTLTSLHSIFETQVFLAVCWGLWDRFGKEVLYALEISKENRSWYRGSRIALSIVDGVFGSQMQMLVGNALQGNEVKPPRSVLEAHSVLSKDFVSYKDSIYYR